MRFIWKLKRWCLRAHLCIVPDKADAVAGVDRARAEPALDETHGDSLQYLFNSCKARESDDVRLHAVQRQIDGGGRGVAHTTAVKGCLKTLPFQQV